MDKAIERETALQVQSTTYIPPSRWTRLRRAIWRERLMYILILPGVFYYLLFVYLPLLGNIIAFQNYQVFLASLEGPIKGFLLGPWVGFQHFREMPQDPDFMRALKNTTV